MLWPCDGDDNGRRCGGGLLWRRCSGRPMVMTMGGDRRWSAMKEKRGCPMSLGSYKVSVFCRGTESGFNSLFLLNLKSAIVSINRISA
ncbi:hypothetical protein R6Q59_005048 [Mikania micrantha]